MKPIAPRKAAWAAPPAVALVIAGAVALPNLANAAPNLPDVTPEQLLANVVAAQPVALSGRVEFTANLGLPDLSGIGSLDQLLPADPLSLLAGTSTIAVWEDPAAGARVALEDGQSEVTLVANAERREAWLYRSDQDKAVHFTSDAAPAATQAPAPLPQDLPTPEAIAKRLVEAASPTTQLATGKNLTVAGHDAYLLSLTPKDPGSLVESVDIAVDAQTWLPLRVRVWSTQQSEPAVQAGFTELDYAAPKASVFQFAPPASAEVEEAALGQSADHGQVDMTHVPDAEPTVVVDAGWASVVELAPEAESYDVALQLGDGPGGAAVEVPSEGFDEYTATVTLDDQAPGEPGLADALKQLGAQLAQPTEAGTVYSTSLLNVLVTPGGRVLAGAVPVAALVAAAK